MRATARMSTISPRTENPVAIPGTDNASNFDFFGTENKQYVKKSKQF